MLVISLILDDMSEISKNAQASTSTPNEAENNVSETRANHLGKIRNFPHVKGNWATHIYLPIEFNETQIGFMKTLIDLIRQNDVNMYLCDDFHVSLSKTFPIKLHHIEELWKCINETFSDCQQFECDVSEIKILLNDEKTRTFIAFELNKDNRLKLNDLVKKCNLCLKKFRFPTYYKNPVFHVSFGWCVNDMENVLNEKIVAKANDMFKNYLTENGGLPVSIPRLQYKSGNRVFNRKFD